MTQSGLMRVKEKESFTNTTTNQATQKQTALRAASVLPHVLGSVQYCSLFCFYFSGMCSAHELCCFPSALHQWVKARSLFTLVLISPDICFLGFSCTLIKSLSKEGCFKWDTLDPQTALSCEEEEWICGLGIKVKTVTDGRVILIQKNPTRDKV